MAEIEYLDGIDVSYHQGDIDWGEVAKTVDFAIIRAGFGQGNCDKTHVYNLLNCDANGIPFGLYWFSYATSVEDARNEANYLIKVADQYLDYVNKRKEESLLLYPLIFDFEYDSSEYYKNKTGKKLDAKTFNLFAQAFCERIEEAGYYAMIYVNEDYRKNYLSQETATKYDVWYARYSSKLYNDFHLHQYSSAGRVDGITGVVDLNNDYINFPVLIKSTGLNHVNDNKKSVDYVHLFNDLNGRVSESLDIETDENKRNALKMLKAHILEAYQNLSSLA